MSDLFTFTLKVNKHKIIFVINTVLCITFFSCEDSKPKSKQEVQEQFPKTSSEVVKTDTFHADSSLTENYNFDIFNLTKDSLFQDRVYFSDQYSNDTLSIFCFRGNQYRNKPSRGLLNGTPKRIKKCWEFETGYDTTLTDLGKWGGGAGWTGQACAINWTLEQKQKLGITDKNFLNDDNAIEIIIGSLCGDIYFLNAETGKPTRKNLSINNPIKGSVSVDPRKNGLLYVGQGVPHKGRFGAYVFDMFSRKEVFHINGNDKDSRRKWGAFDSNALIEKNSGNVFWPGENGMLYNFTLDEDRKLKKMKKMRYQHSQLFRQGIESSLAAIGQYGFFLDNSGSLVCVDLNKLKPIWNVSNFDDSDATTMIDKENKDYFLYTGHEVDKLAPAHEVFFRKIAAKDGKEIWRVSRKCFGGKIKDKTIDGGILASPVLGKNKGNHLVFTVFSRIDKKDKAEIVAINKITGKEEWSIILDKFSWSSPVDFYDADGNIYLFFTDVTGNIYIVNGTDGKLILKERSEYTFESSPIIIDDKVYIASRGRSILCYNILTD